MKTKVLISFAVTAKLICVFVFAYAKRRFSHDTAHITDLLFLGVPGEPLPITSEEDIFDYLGMEFKKPSDRIA